ncbi:hypothetical protein JOC86_003784 [Bacillus pakistanensis]|uniref:Inhibitor I9 domain-containing protein n=1 Tax=Rossellomorea pakistanensis TaxID=992288 RepID=A0ABS2NH74_9BACI|nr:hypothetical protein [Bacillus pakistanensis]
MKKCYCRALLIVLVMAVSGCQASKGDNTYPLEERGGEETMDSSVEIDPAIDLSSSQTISIVIHFTTQPAKIAVLEAEKKGIDLTFEEAVRQVENSHRKFQEEIRTTLEENQVPYQITHRYKTAFNGVSMKMPANEIHHLTSSTVIQKIYANEDIQLDPPTQPTEQL